MIRFFNVFVHSGRRFLWCGLLCFSVGMGFLYSSLTQAQETGDVGVSAEVVGGEEEEEEEEEASAPDAPGAATIPDNTPPFLFNLRHVIVSPTQAVVLWQTDEEANTILEYAPDDGVTAFGRIADAYRVRAHEAPLSGLLPCTGYRYRARSADTYGNESISGERVLSMPCDIGEPEPIGVRVVDITDHSAVIIWTTREPATSVVEFGETELYGSRASLPGFVTIHAVPLAGLLFETRYHFRVLSRDPSGNESMSGDLVFQTLPDQGTLTPTEPLPRAPGSEEGQEGAAPSPEGPSLAEPLPEMVTEPLAPSAPPFNIRLLGSDRTLALEGDGEGGVGVLAGSLVTVVLFPERVEDALVEAYLFFGDEIYPTTLREDRLEALLMMPEEAGTVPLRVRVRFADGALSEHEIILRVQDQGRVFIRPLIGPAWEPITGAIVTLFYYNGTSWLLWDGGSYGQPNPLFTDGEGRYAFQVPPGLYRVEVKKQGFVPYQSEAVFVDGNVFAVPIRLVSIPGETGAEDTTVVQPSWFMQAAFGIKLLRQWLEQGVAQIAVRVLASLFVIFGVWNVYAFSILGTRTRILAGLRHQKGAALDLSEDAVHEIRCREQPARRRIAFICVVLGGGVAAVSPTVFSGISFGSDLLFALLFVGLDRSCRVRSKRSV